MLIVSEKVSTPAPEGLHLAVCTSVIYLGLQQTTFGLKPQIMLMWKLPDCLMDDGRPFMLSRKFTATLSKKGNLRPILEGFNGRKFTVEELQGVDIKTFLGKSCQVMVQHSPSQDGGRLYANIESIVPAPKGAAITPQAELLHYDQDNPDLAIRQKLPEWITRLLDSAVTPSKLTSVIPPQPVLHSPVAAESDKNFDDDLQF